MNTKFENSIIITYKELIPLLLSEKKQMQIKILSRDEAIERLTYSFNDDAIKCLMKNNISFIKAKKYLNLFSSTRFLKNEKLKEKFNLLDDKCYVQDNYFAKFLTNKKIYLYGLKEDNQLQELLTDLKIKFELIDINDGEIYHNDFDISNIEVKMFNNKFLQYLFIFSDIRKLIISNQFDQNKIQILVNDKFDLFYINIFSNLFQINTYSKINKMLFDYPDIKNQILIFRNNFEEIKNKKTTFTKLIYASSPSLDNLKELLIKYSIDDIEDKDLALNNIVEIVNTTSFEEDSDISGIRIVDNFTILPDFKTYITNFQYGAFYKEFNDDDVISDKEKQLIGLNPSFVKTSLDKNLKYCFIRYSDCDFVSRVNQHLDDHIYDSQLIKEYGIKSINYDYNDKGVYTNDVKNILIALKLDDIFYDKKYGEFKSYDPSYKKHDLIKHLTYDKKTQKDLPYEQFSPSVIEEYVNCPFKFYLNKYLKIIDKNDKYALYLGTLIHVVMTYIDYDIKPDSKPKNEKELFDFAWEEGTKKFKEKIDDKQRELFSNTYKHYLEIVKIWFWEIWNIYRSQILKLKNKFSNSKIKILEKEKEIEYFDEYHFVGRIDAMLYMPINKDQGFYSIIDYKTSHKNFEPKTVCVGLGCQLPLYYHFVRNNTNNQFTKNFNFGSLGLKKVLSSKPKKIVIDDKSKTISIDSIINYLTLDGVLTNNSKFYAMFKDAEDPTKLISFIPIEPNRTEDNVGVSINKLLKKYSLDDLVADAIAASKKIIKQIMNNDFHIYPIPLKPMEKINEKTRLMCSYCSYKNICYREREKQVCHDVYSEIKEHFSKIQNAKPKGE